MLLAFMPKQLLCGFLWNHLRGFLNRESSERVSCQHICWNTCTLENMYFISQHGVYFEQAITPRVKEKPA